MTVVRTLRVRVDWVQFPAARPQAMKIVTGQGCTKTGFNLPRSEPKALLPGFPAARPGICPENRGFIFGFLVL